jgi:hypothetical protein
MAASLRYAILEDLQLSQGDCTMAKELSDTARESLRLREETLRLIELSRAEREMNGALAHACPPATGEPSIVGETDPAG